MKKKAMKAAMKKVGKKSMKAKRVSTIARGRMAKTLVFRGSKVKTSGGLERDALTKNRRGKVVSKRASANGKARFRAIQSWVECLSKARGLLRVSGFVTVNGNSPQGKALYAKAKERMQARRAAQ